MPTAISRLVVLMLENRSFDHMLGFLKLDGAAQVDGLTGNEWNFPAGPNAEGPNVPVTENAGDVEDFNPDPNHEFDHVSNQISSTGDPVGNPDMKGFVRDYFTAHNDADHAAKIMNCFTPDTLPILNTLAKEYGVCDQWFSSVPGSTIPNRLFVHAASSDGSVAQDAIAAPFAVHTIFEYFGHTNIHDCAIYTSGASILLANKFLMLNQDKFRDYSDFVFDATHGYLPAYTFIEPTYDDDGNGNFANSQHPDFPVDRGEALIAEVYSALSKSPKWNSTLLLIVYDEHGGIYDHVPPPKVTNTSGAPDLRHSGAPENFDFTRLGVRVPAVFVSPCIKPGTIIRDPNNRPFDHCSVVATVRKLFCDGTQPFNWREEQAPTFDQILELTGTDIRTDVVPLPTPVISAGVVDLTAAEAAAQPRTPTDLAVLMAGAMNYSLQQLGLPSPGDPAALLTASEVGKYLADSLKASSSAGGTQ
jgi:phospholipase C